MKTSRPASKGWLWWPVSLMTFVLALVEGHEFAVKHKQETVYWVLVWILVAFYTVASIYFLHRFARPKWRNFRNVIAKGRRFDQLEDDLEKWKTAAGVATARGEDLEKRLATWNRDSLVEGRRRLYAEMAAIATGASFSGIEFREDGGELEVGAKWIGAAPPCGLTVGPPNQDSRGDTGSADGR